MSEFYYSSLKKRASKERIDAVVRDISEAVFGDSVTVEVQRGVPMSRGDDRARTWLFWDMSGSSDCSFTISLLRDGRLEFKVPRTQWDEHWERQQSVRRRLVRRLNAV